MYVSKEQELLNILILRRDGSSFQHGEQSMWTVRYAPWAEWKPIVPGKTPYLSACSGNLTDNSRDQGDDYHRNHNIRSHVAVRRIVEELNEGVAGRAA
ncbi:hypothetical protein MMC06_002981 [Schaereria dolodes]|nr:hypothetical protein [Schaereria dolodes]